MPKWMGLDSAGAEQLWNANLIKGALEVFKRHEPFSRNDPHSPIYSDLRSVYPNVSWIQRDGRPIFRKNPLWEKLGLLTPGTDNVHVSIIGDAVLSGEKDFSEVFIEASRDHRERDGTPSYGIMCAAALEMPNELFSLEDIECGVSKSYQPEQVNLVHCLREARVQRQSIPSNSNRKRVLKSFMKVLVIAGAFASVDDRWRLDNRNAAEEIASALVRRPLVQSGMTSEQSLSQRPRERSMRSLREIIQDRPMRTVTPSLVPPNPEQRAQLLEKANSLHEKIVAMVAGVIRQAGGIPFDHPQSIDAAAKFPTPVILEVKTIHSANALDQIRNAVAKLWEYRWRWREEFPQETSLVIVTSANPESFLGTDIIEYLTVDRGLKLFWLDGDQLVDGCGNRLQDFLVPRA